MKGQWVRKPNSDVVVVFIHGIFSDGDSCWKNNKSGAYWPNLVASDSSISLTGVYVFTYKTSFNSGTFRLGNVINSLKEHMRLDGVLSNKHIIFVAHSMGGIIARKFVLELAVDFVNSKTRFSFFLVASPSLGSKYANLLEPLAKLFGHTQADALRFSQDNAWLMDLDSEFNNLKSKAHLCIDGKELIEDCSLIPLIKTQIVETFSAARYFGDPYKVPDSDHSTIAKPENEDSIQHRLLIEFICDHAGFQKKIEISEKKHDSEYIPNSTGVSGLSHKIDSIHIHVDGAHARELIQDFAICQNNMNRITEISSIERFISGPQRNELSTTYKLHTPGKSEKEELDYFSTTQLYLGSANLNKEICSQITQIANDLLCDLDQKSEETEGVVVELERVVGVVSSEGVPEISEALYLPSNIREFLLEGMLFAPFNKLNNSEPARAAAYEFHFSIDIPKKNQYRPIDLNYLIKLSNEIGLNIGGWFMFADKNRWAYRSNSFESEVSKEILENRWATLRSRLLEDNLVQLREARLRLLAEEVLAVWKIPVKLQQDNVITLHKLAFWEKNISELEEFWVILPNFLGDKHNRIAAAMLSNFKREARYVYFLRSNADAKRWLDFKKALVEREPNAEHLMAAYVVGFSDLKEWRNVAAFIANPGRPTAEGVRLQLDPYSNQVVYGYKMPGNRVQAIVQGLSPILTGGAISHWHKVEPAPPPTLVVAVCINLVTAPSEEMFEILDGELASIASTLGGEIASYGSKSITAVFNGTWIGIERAYNFSTLVLNVTNSLGLQRNIVRAGIDFSEARQVPRACGTLWTGTAISGCRAVLYDAAMQQGIYATKRVNEFLLSKNSGGSQTVAAAI